MNWLLIAGSTILSPLDDYPKPKLVVVMVLNPIVMNAC